MKSALAERLPPLDENLFPEGADLDTQRRITVLRARALCAGSRALRNLAAAELRNLENAVRRGDGEITK